MTKTKVLPRLGCGFRVGCEVAKEEGGEEVLEGGGRMKCEAGLSRGEDERFSVLVDAILCRLRKILIELAVCGRALDWLACFAADLGVSRLEDKAGGTHLNVWF